MVHQTLEDGQPGFAEVVLMLGDEVSAAEVYTMLEDLRLVADYQRRSSSLSRLPPGDAPGWVWPPLQSARSGIRANMVAAPPLRQAEAILDGAMRGCNARHCGMGYRNASRWALEPTYGLAGGPECALVLRSTGIFPVVHRSFTPNRDTFHNRFTAASYS